MILTPPGSPTDHPAMVSKRNTQCDGCGSLYHELLRTYIPLGRLIIPAGGRADSKYRLSVNTNLDSVVTRNLEHREALSSLPPLIRYCCSGRLYLVSRSRSVISHPHDATSTLHSMWHCPKHQNVAHVFALGVQAVRSGRRSYQR